MTNEKEKANEMTVSEDTAKAPYGKPVLLNLGKLTCLTMGSQPGAGESGGAELFFPTN